MFQELREEANRVEIEPCGIIGHSAHRERAVSGWRRVAHGLGVGVRSPISAEALAGLRPLAHPSPTPRRRFAPSEGEGGRGR
jgi:hypothetical protein